MQIIDDTIPLPLPRDSSLTDLNRFRAGLYRCLTRRGDTLFELADATACATGNVTDLARLSLQSEHRRGHGSLYDSLNSGQTNIAGMRRLLADTLLPTMTGPDGRDRIVLAVDVSNWLRPDAATSPDRASETQPEP